MKAITKLHLSHVVLGLCILAVGITALAATVTAKPAKAVNGVVQNCTSIEMQGGAVSMESPGMRVMMMPFTGIARVYSDGDTEVNFGDRTVMIKSRIGDTTFTAQGN